MAIYTTNPSNVEFGTVVITFPNCTHSQILTARSWLERDLADLAGDEGTPEWAALFNVLCDMDTPGYEL